MGEEFLEVDFEVGTRVGVGVGGGEVFSVHLFELCFKLNNFLLLFF